MIMAASALNARALQPFQYRAVAPTRSRRALTVVARKTATKAAQAYICIDCGYIYDGSTPFEKLPANYRCPVCNAPKRRFRPTESKARSNDTKAMRQRMDAMARGEDDGKFDEGDKNFFIVAAAGGAAILGALYFVLNSQTQF